MIKKSKGTIVTMFVIAVVVLYVLIYLVPNIGDTFQKTQIAIYDNIQVKDILDCYIIRDETVFFSKKEGVIKYYVAEGDRVKKNSTIVSIDSNQKKSNANSEITEINKRIDSLNSGENVFENDLKNIQDISSHIVEEIVMEKDKGNISKVRDLSERLNKIIEKRTKLLNNRRLELMSSKGDYNSQRIIESILHTNVDSYRSANPGVISYFVDGYETEFNPATMYLLKKDDVEKVQGNVQSVYREYALEKEPIFKLVNAQEWYTASWIKNDSMNNYDIGNKIVFTLPKGKVEGKVHDIMMEDDYSLVIIRINEYYPEFWKMRKITAPVVALNYEGLKISNESIVVMNGKTGVFVSDIDHNFTFTQVKIIGSNSKYTIIESGYFYEKTEEGNIKINTVDLYDEILRNGKSKLENGS